VPIDTNILIYLIKILLSHVAERIYALADDDYLVFGAVVNPHRRPSAQALEGGGEPFRRTVQGLAAGYTRYGVLIEAPSQAERILFKVKSHRIRGDGARPNRYRRDNPCAGCLVPRYIGLRSIANPAAAPRFAAFSRAVRLGVRDQSPRGA